MNKGQVSKQSFNNGEALIANDRDENYPCFAAKVEKSDRNGQMSVALKFKNVAGLESRIERGLKFIRHNTVLNTDQSVLNIEFSGIDNIVVGLPALFKQVQTGWEDNVVSKPVISEAMQDALLDECNDFLKRSVDMSSPDEF